MEDTSSYQKDSNYTKSIVCSFSTEELRQVVDHAVGQVIHPCVWARPATTISHCSHLLLKCRVTTNICHWLRVQSRWFKNYIFLYFQILLLLFLHTLLLCHIFAFRVLDIFNTIRVSNRVDPDQA